MHGLLMHLMSLIHFPNQRTLNADVISSKKRHRRFCVWPDLGVGGSDVVAKREGTTSDCMRRMETSIGGILRHGGVAFLP